MATAADLAKQEMNPRYLGDGVYASSDGYHIWLRVDMEFGAVHAIALDPSTLHNLQQYILQRLISDLFKPVKPEPPDE